MSNRKRYSDEGIGRILKSTLAQAVDSAGPRTRRDLSQRVHRHESTSKKNLNKDRDHDDLDAVNIQAALQNIRSLPGSGLASDESFQISYADKESSSDSAIKNIVVRVNNDNAAVRKSSQSNDKRFNKNIREVRELKNGTHDQTHNGNLSQTHFEKDLNYQVSSSKSHGADKAHVRRNDVGDFKRKDERKGHDIPPHLRIKKTEEMNDVEGQRDQRKVDDKFGAEKVVILDMQDEKSKSSFVEQKELDAYDKWKLKRQNTSSANNKTNFNRPGMHHGGSTSLKTREQMIPRFKDQRDAGTNHTRLPATSEKIESFTVYSSKMSDSDTIHEESIPDIIKQHVLNSSPDECNDEGGPGLSDSYDERGADKVMMKHAQKEQPVIVRDENSAMDKIQNLFQTYTSPVSQRNDKNHNQSKSDAKISHQKQIVSNLGYETKQKEDETLLVTRGDGCEPVDLRESEQTLDSCYDNDDNSIDIDLKVARKDQQGELDKGMESLQLTDDNNMTESASNCHDSDEALKKKKQVCDPSNNSPNFKYPSHVQNFLKSPASIPSGFSSDYEVGIVSQSQSETEDDESPYPCAANLFPSSQSNRIEEEKQPQQQQQQPQLDFSSSTPFSQWPRFCGNQQPMPHQMSYQYPPWFHPYYNHPDPFCHPYNRVPPQHAHYPGFMGMESSPFPGQQQAPPNPQLSQAIKSKNKLIIPADKFIDEDSINKVNDFVATKTEEWNKFMIHHHGRAEPVDVVISVTLAGVETENEDPGHSMAPNSYPAHGAWPYHMYPQPNMGYNYNSYWSQAYGDENGAYSMQHVNIPHGPGQMEKEEVDGERLNEKLRTRFQHSTDLRPGFQNRIPEHSHPSYSQSEVNPLADTEKRLLCTISENDCTTDPEDMKRRALSFDDCDRSNTDGQVTKKRAKSQDRDDIENESKPQDNVSRENSAETVPDRKCRTANSVSSFLNPNDLKNDWRTPPKTSLSSSSAAMKQSKYDFVTSQATHISSIEKERDRSPTLHSRFQHRSYRSNKQGPLNDGDEDNLDHQASPAPAPVPLLNASIKTSYDQKSVCVVERKSSSFESGVEQKQLPEERVDYEPITGKWAEICPEPEPAASDSSFSNCSSPQDVCNIPNRRRSDSYVGYGSDNRSPLTRDYRMTRTPGMNVERRKDYGSWKEMLIDRSKLYKHQFIDTHCHIDFMYNRTYTATIPFKQYVKSYSDSFPANYGGCVAVFCNPKVFSDHTQAYGILQLLVKEDNVWVAIGCHPKSAKEFNMHHLLRLRRFLVEHPRVVALGEIGLDYSGSFGRHADVQKEVFIQQLKLAVELKLPLVIHCRDADTDCLEIMKKNVPVKYKIHLHCFTRHISICREFMDHFPNLFVGFTPLITFSTATDASDAAALVPLNRLLLETDAPYFIPAGVPSFEMKGVSHPGFALFTAERIAHLKELPVDTVLEACRENTRSMYGI